MALFVSRRERRLWLWTLTVVVAIYSTLGLAGSLADVLDNRDLTTVSFALGMLLIGVTVVTQGLRTKPSGAEIGVASGGGSGLSHGFTPHGACGTQPPH